MENRFKFRAWDKKSGNFNYYDLVDMFYCDPTGKEDNWIWQQNTGLTDKNGKEIYEGDIVGGGYDTYDAEKYYYFKYCDKCVGFRIFNNYTGDIDECEICNGDMLPCDFKNLEIVGNIYEGKK